MNSSSRARKVLLGSVLVTAICLGLLAACGMENLSTSPAPPPGTDRAFESVDRVLASMNWANIAFNAPVKIHLKETVQIQLLLSLQKSIDELYHEIRLAGMREGATIHVSDRMQARLSGSNFRITAITPEEQAVGSIGTVEWRWEVSPRTSGNHTLYLTLTALFDANGRETRRAIKTFDKTIEVEVTLGQQVLEFFENNWQWMWAAILVPIAGWVWKGRKKRRRR